MSCTQQGECLHLALDSIPYQFSLLPVFLCYLRISYAIGINFMCLTFHTFSCCVLLWCRLGITIALCSSFSLQVIVTGNLITVKKPIKEGKYMQCNLHELQSIVHASREVYQSTVHRQWALRVTMMISPRRKTHALKSVYWRSQGTPKFVGTSQGVARIATMWMCCRSVK